MSCQPGADTTNVVVRACPLKLFRKNEPPKGLSRTEMVISTDEEEKPRLKASAADIFQNGEAVNCREKSGELRPEAFKTKDRIPGLDSAKGIGAALEFVYRGTVRPAMSGIDHEYSKEMLLLFKEAGSETEAVSNTILDLRIGKGTSCTDTIGRISEVTKTDTENVPATTERRPDLKAWMPSKIFSPTGKGSRLVTMLTGIRAEH